MKSVATVFLKFSWLHAKLHVSIDGFRQVCKPCKILFREDAWMSLKDGFNFNSVIERWGYISASKSLLKSIQIAQCCKLSVWRQISNIFKRLWEVYFVEQAAVLYTWNFQYSPCLRIVFMGKTLHSLRENFDHISTHFNHLSCKWLTH